MALAIASPPGQPRRTRLYVMASESLFAGVNRTDASAALRVWMDALGRRRGFDFDGKLDVFDSPAEAAARLKNNPVDMLLLDTPDYWHLAATKLLEPVAAGSQHGAIGAYEYLLLSRDLPEGAGFAPLESKRIAVSSRTGSNMGAAWIETMLAAQRARPTAEFFASVALGHKPSACVLPVFFGRLDACVVDSNNFELLKELNPQLARLRVLARSEPVVEGVIAMHARPHPYREELIAALHELHKDPAGAQMVLLFKTGPLVAAKQSDLETTLALWEKSLRAASGKARAATGASVQGGKEMQ
jgi:phosphonate transport system substrate-binding protein